MKLIAALQGFPGNQVNLQTSIFPFSASFIAWIALIDLPTSAATAASPDLKAAAAAAVTPVRVAPIPSLLCRTHAPNDCVPDALSYMHQLAVLRPELKTELLRVHRGREEHVMTLITDPNNNLWVRDEYCMAVMRLDFKGPKTDLTKIGQEALRVYESETRWEYSGPGNYEPPRPVCNGRQDRIKAVQHIQRLIPGSQSFIAGDVTLNVWSEPKGAAGNFRYHVYIPEKGTEEIEIPQPVPEIVVASTIAKAERIEHRNVVALALPITPTSSRKPAPPYSAVLDPSRME